MITAAAREQLTPPVHVEEEGLVVGGGGDLEGIACHEGLEARRLGEILPDARVGSARHPGDSGSPGFGERLDLLDLGSREGLESRQHRCERRAENVSSEHDDDVFAGVLDAAPLEGREGEDRDADGLVAHQLQQPRHVQDATGRQAIEIEVEGLDGVEVVLGERVSLGRVGAQGVGKPEVDLVVALLAACKHRAAVTHRRRHTVPRVGSVGQLAQRLVDHADDALVEFDDVDGTLPQRQGRIDVSSTAAPDDQSLAGAGDLVPDALGSCHQLPPAGQLRFVDDRDGRVHAVVNDRREAFVALGVHPQHPSQRRPAVRI